MRKIVLLPIAMLLMGAAGPAGCTPNLSPAGLYAVCSALVGPLRYTIANKKSGRYAGPILGLDLEHRNQIGLRLGCPQFRT